MRFLEYQIIPSLEANRLNPIGLIVAHVSYRSGIFRSFRLQHMDVDGFVDSWIRG